MKSWCKWNSGLSVKRSFYFLLVFILSGCKSTSDKDASGSIQKIILDSSQSKRGYDISSLLEQNIEVIKLETASDCLLRADGNAFFTDDYNLIRLNPTDGSRKYYLPYEPEINQKNQQWKLNKYISKYRDTVQLIYPRIDTIYKVFSNTVCPEYAVNFVHNKIPESLLNQRGTEILRTSIDQGYIVGLEKVCVSRDYIFGYFGEGKKIQEFIYFKAKEESVIAESLLLKNWGNLRALNYTVTDHDDFIFMYDALSLKEAWQYIVSRNPFLKEEDREKLRSVTESLQDEDNPVLFKCKLKKI